MTWEMFSQGGAWVLAMGIGYAVLTGRLRLSREVDDRDGTIAELKLEKQELADELRDTAIKAEASIRAEQELTRQELAELRKTNAALVASFTESRSR